MQACRLTITTVADGQENSIVRVGALDLAFGRVVVQYNEDQAKVCISLQGERAILERNGDYSLRLQLTKDAEDIGYIGMTGTTGEIRTYTKKIAYSTTKDSLLLSLHYDLIFGEERQEMRLRLYAKLQGDM